MDVIPDEILMMIIDSGLVYSRLKQTSSVTNKRINKLLPIDKAKLRFTTQTTNTKQHYTPRELYILASVGVHILDYDSD